MGIALARVDDRLIHGQVVHGWVAFLGLTWLVVADDRVAGDSLKWTLYRMAVPDRIRLDVLRVAEAAALLRGHAESPEMIGILFAEPAAALEYLEAGGPLKSLNVGGVRHQGTRLKLGSAIFMDDEDVQVLQQVRNRKIPVEIRTAPRDRSVPLEKIP